MLDGERNEQTLGKADDSNFAGMSYPQAVAAAFAWADERPWEKPPAPTGPNTRTVRSATEHYIEQHRAAEARWDQESGLLFSVVMCSATKPSPIPHWPI